MPDVRSLPRARYGGIQRSLRLGPGFHRESWIPTGVYPDENRGRNDTFYEYRGL
jgi:hypothetical protein